MSIATATHLDLMRARPLRTPLIAAVACTALADWLFYGWDVGISLALFLGVLGIVAVAGNRPGVTSPVQLVMGTAFVIGLMALAENVSVLSVFVSGLATALFVIVVTGREASSWQRDLFEAMTIPFRGPFQMAGDLIRTLRDMKLAPGWQGSLVAWIVPLSVFAVFAALFTSANPLIENRLSRLHPDDLLGAIDLQRSLFWLLIICTIWPLIRRRPRRAPSPRTAAETATPAGKDYLLGVQAMSRSLILFNALFAVQTGLDLAYLWGGFSLPDGMSHAEYAHRGAYPLMMTALLAAGFVLVAMRPGGPAENSRLIRPLVLLWIAQNILLVVSSIFRLDLYVATYSLTYLRLAALIWMGLVATGLVLILVQIKLNKSNSWLLSANAIALALTLYACCFINAPWLVASYNVQHCREIDGTGPKLDLQYLESLGPQAEPALRPYFEKMPPLELTIHQRRQVDLGWWRPKNWRAWNFRAWRLQRYLANNPSTSPSPENDNKG
jgi:Domain of unknown function (DUF4173)